MKFSPFARMLTGGAVLCLTMPAFAQTAQKSDKTNSTLAIPAGERMSTSSQCPVMNGAAGPYRHTAASALSNHDWWPNQLNLRILHQNSTKSDPMGSEFNYAAE